MVVAALATLLLATPGSGAPGEPAPGDEEMVPLTVTGGERGSVTSTQGAVARRAKMYITVRPTDPIWGVFYNNMWNMPADDPTMFQALCQRNRPCIPDPFRQPACATDDITTQRRGLYLRYLLYPVRPLDAGGVDVGFIASTKVNLPAFGAIPAQATLTLRSPRVDGRVEPFRIQLWQTGNSTRGCDPDAATSVDTLVEAKVEIQLSDLSVDGVPVDLGDECRTVEPADLDLWGETESGGYFPNTGGNLGAYDGLHPGSLGPLTSPFYRGDEGRTLPPSTGLTIPPFAGCRGADGQDLSTLVTTMASGPDNPVRVKQGTVIVPPGGVDLDDLTRCSNTCPLPAPDAPEQPPLPAGDEG